MEHVYEVLDAAKELKEKIKTSFKEGAINQELLASWIEKVIEIDELEAKKLDELFERLVRLEDEIRGKGGPEEIPAKKE